MNSAEASKNETASSANFSQPTTSTSAASAQSSEIGNWIAEILSGNLKDVENWLMAMPEHERTSFCLAIIGAMDARGMRTLMNTYFKGGGDEEQVDKWAEVIGETSLLAFASRWAEIDLDGMLSFAEGNSKNSIREAGMGEFVAFAAVLFASEKDLDRAFAFASKFCKGEAGEAFEVLPELIAERDPEKALELSQAEGLDFELSDYYESVKVPSEHLDDVLNLADEDERNESLNTLLTNWAEKDPAAAFAAALQHGKGNQVEYVFETMVQLDPEMAKQYLTRLPVEQQPELALKLADKLADKDSAAAMEWAKANLDDTRFSEFLGSADLPAIDALQFAGQMTEYPFQQIFSRYVEEDPVAALRWLNAQPPEIVKKTGSSNMAEALSRLEPAKLRTALDLLPSGEIRTNTIRELTGRIGARSPEEARSLLSGLSGEDRSAAAIGLASSWAARDPGAALDFLATENNPAASGTALYVWSSSEPSAAYQWMVDHHGSNPAMLGQLAAESTLATKWGYKDPAAAAAAMASLPAQVAPGQTASVVGLWANYDSISASAFINEKLVPGPVRDQAVLALVQRIRLRDPQSAAEWIGTISDPSLRAKAVGK